MSPTYDPTENEDAREECAKSALKMDGFNLSDERVILPIAQRWAEGEWGGYGGDAEILARSWLRLRMRASELEIVIERTLEQIESGHVGIRGSLERRELLDRLREALPS